MTSFRRRLNTAWHRASPLRQAAHCTIAAASGSVNLFAPTRRVGRPGDPHRSALRAGPPTRPEKETHELRPGPHPAAARRVMVAAAGDAVEPGPRAAPHDDYGTGGGISTTLRAWFLLCPNWNRYPRRIRQAISRAVQVGRAGSPGLSYHNRLPAPCWRHIVRNSLSSAALSVGDGTPSVMLAWSRNQSSACSGKVLRA